MKFMKLQMLVVAFVIFAASQAFAALSYNVTVDTSSLYGQEGYLYFTNIPVNGADSSATVSNYQGGVLAAYPSLAVENGSAVTGALPGVVTFGTANGINDYNHGIIFGNTINFILSFNGPVPGGPEVGSSTFSLGLFQDEGGGISLLGGTLFTIDLFNDGSTSVAVLANEANVTPTPIPAAAWLLGSGLAGLAGLRRRFLKAA